MGMEEDRERFEQMTNGAFSGFEQQYGPGVAEAVAKQHDVQYRMAELNLEHMKDAHNLNVITVKKCHDIQDAKVRHREGMAARAFGTAVLLVTAAFAVFILSIAFAISILF